MPIEAHVWDPEKERLQREVAMLRSVVKTLEKENFEFCANQCHGGHGTPGGNHRCEYQAEIEKLESENLKLKADVETLGYQLTCSKHTSDVFQRRIVEVESENRELTVGGTWPTLHRMRENLLCEANTKLFAENSDLKDRMGRLRELIMVEVRIFPGEGVKFKGEPESSDKL